MENNEITNGNKLPVSMKLDPVLYSLVTQLASEEDRTLSNMIERLIKTNPLIQEMLGETEAVAA